tara:strand:+ start:22775 stop:23281 length:507 start_codon:yes stop_codon:yes gene_type:complete
METKINKKISEYLRKYKDDIKNKLIDYNLEKETLMEIVQYVFDYENLVLTNDDFSKRKRTKNVVPLHDRCIALRSSGEQCTRRKRDGCNFCGTHIKGSPNGIYEEKNDNNVNIGQKIEIYTQEIQGILYYIDNDNNVYDMNDIMRNEQSPKVIMKYEKSEEGVYKLIK